MLFLPFRFCMLYHLLLHLVLLLPAKIREFACFIKILAIYSNSFRAFPIYSHNFGFLITHSEPSSRSLLLQFTRFSLHHLWSR